MPSGSRLESKRNLVQYRNLTDQQFADLMAREALDVAPIKEFEKRINAKLEEFDIDYDLSDMKINDKLLLRALAQAFITLEDYEILTFKLRAEGVNDATINLINSIEGQKSKLRSDISKFQDDLKIARKIRKGDRQESVIAYIDDLKEKAKKFYEAKMSYVFCPNCNMLLATVWTLYPDADNKLTFRCQRKLHSGEKCNTKVVVTTSELLEKKGSNKPELLPESIA